MIVKSKILVLIVLRWIELTIIFLLRLVVGFKTSHLAFRITLWVIGWYLRVPVVLGLPMIMTLVSFVSFRFVT